MDPDPCVIADGVLVHTVHFHHVPLFTVNACAVEVCGDPVRVNPCFPLVFAGTEAYPDSPSSCDPHPSDVLCWAMTLKCLLYPFSDTLHACVFHVHSIGFR